MARKLQQKIAKKEIPEFLENPQKYIYRVYCVMLSDFTKNCGIEEVEVEELEIYTDQEVKNNSSELLEAKEKFTKITSKLLDFFNEFKPDRDNKELLKNFAAINFDCVCVNYIVARFLLLMDFARSTCFIGINPFEKKAYTGEELLMELFTYNLKVVQEYIKLFDGKMDNTGKFLDKARKIVEGDKKWEKE